MYFRNIAYWISLFVTVCSSAIAQQQDRPATQNSSQKGIEAEREDEKKARRALEIQNFILVAKAQPPEVSADLLLQLASRSSGLPNSTREEIVEEIFRRASEAKEPVRLKQRAGMVDTRAGYTSISHELNLDQLSIQLRSVRLMLTINKTKARNLFREIPPIKPELLTCNTSLDYDFSDFYSVLKQVTEETFDSEARMRREHVQLASSYLDQVTLPSQIGPAIDFLVSVRVSSQDFGNLVDSFVVALKALNADPRSFSNSIRYGGLTGKIRFSLLKRMQESRVSQEDLVGAYRRYLTKHLSATQCADSLITTDDKTRHETIDQANTLFENKLGEDDVRPEKIDPGANERAYWKSNRSAELLRGVKGLRFGDGRLELSLSERNSQEWQQKLTKFLEHLNSWKAEDEDSDIDYLHQKSVLYITLIDLTPSGQMSTSILREFALFLRDSAMQKSDPLHWLHYFKELRKIGSRLKGDAKIQFDSIISGVGSPVFVAYGQLDRIILKTP